MTSAQVLHWLRAHADPEYGAFAATLLPGVSDVLGVRLPALRALARKLATEGAQETLNALPATPFEARMLHGLVIGYAKADFAQRWAWIDSFLPLIDNWSVCDSFCATLAAQWSDAERTVAWPRVRDCSQSESPFVARFGVVIADVRALRCILRAHGCRMGAGHGIGRFSNTDPALFGGAGDRSVGAAKGRAKGGGVPLRIA